MPYPPGMLLQTPSLLIVDCVSDLGCYKDACSSSARVPNDSVVEVL